MAQREVDRQTLTCVICLDLLKEPVTVPCGHSYCRSCIQSHWAQEDVEYSCPECRQRFRTRPVLGKNIKLAALLEQMKEREDCVARPGDVLCDVCSGVKLRAVHSCLQCLVSFCERHLQPHRDVAMLQKHQLVAPSDNLQDYLCSEHNEVKKMFCRSDQQLLCVICCLDQHKGHDIVSSAAERVQRQPQLENRKQELLKTIKDSELDLKRLHEEAQVISRSAQDAVQHSRQTFTEMIMILKTRCSTEEQQIRHWEKSNLRKIQELQKQVQHDITQRKKTLCEMDKLLKTTDHHHFLQFSSKLQHHRPKTAVSTIPSKDQRLCEPVTKAVSALKEKIQLTLFETYRDVSTALREIRTLQSSRQGFLQYACDITMDPNTANRYLRLSEGNRRVTMMSEELNYPDHPDRFKSNSQVRNKEGLIGRCYWEVECLEPVGVCIAVTYRDTEKYSLLFGDDSRSWVLDGCCIDYQSGFTGSTFDALGPPSSRVGVFLDHSAGLLCFFSVKDQTLALIHRVQTIFTEPLYVGVNVSNDCNFVYFPKL